MSFAHGLQPEFRFPNGLFYVRAPSPLYSLASANLWIMLLVQNEQNFPQLAPAMVV